MANQNRERDLVLAPNEYAYISDETKGHIVAYVGPFKTSMANTDQPVIFDEKSKRFKNCLLEESIKTFTAVPEGWYVTLKNPSQDDNPPTTGTANNLPKLSIGRKVNLPGPAFFALWPGQMVRVIQGHRLRTNQYLIVRVYEEEQAKKNWANAVIQPQKSTKGKAKKSDDNNKEVIPESDIPNLSVGKLLVIRGTNVSFYIPPTGVEVVRDKYGNYVRDAVTLERLEYCILLDENGKKRYIIGPDVVFPEPTETFYIKNGSIKFKAIELSENSGIYVKVISPYTEGKKSYKVGDELFITGKEQMIYYPRIEHALIKYGNQEIYHAVAIPAGEGRYFLSRKTGQIELKKGPCMFLPDPREAVIVQRILTQKQAKLWYPGNMEVLQFNAQLSMVAEKERADNYLTQDQLMKTEEAPKAMRKTSKEIISDEFVRKQTYTSARTITLDTKYQGAVTVEIWTGYAILVTGKTGSRKVIVGPQTYLLEYDESIAVLELSTGKPKNDDRLINTVYLRVLHNKVSDIVNVETKDLCPAEISLSYRVNFEGEPEKWFNVENYVKFLTDHLRSKIRNAVKKLSITEFYNNGIDLLRDTILGKIDENNHRQSGKFDENGMHIYDVEVFDIKLKDKEIEKLLFTAQHVEVKQKLEITAKENALLFTQQDEEINRKIAIEKSVTILEQIDLKAKEIEKKLLLNLADIEANITARNKKLDGKLEKQGRLQKISTAQMNRFKGKREVELEISQKLIEQKILEIQAEVEAVVKKSNAVSPDLVAALQAFSDRALAEKMAETMAPLSIIGGNSIADVFSNLLKGTVLEDVLKKKLLVKDDEESIPDEDYYNDELDDIDE